MDQVALAECTSEELAAAVCQVQALENAVRSSLLELVRACDERKLWAEDGCPSIESWLAMRLGMAWRSAAELVRVSRSLEHRPCIAALAASGALAWDKVRALAIFTTPESDAEWAEAAPTTPVSVLERAARHHRERDEAEAAKAKEGQKLCFRADRDRPVTHIRGSVPNDVSAVIQKAVEREADAIGPNPETGVLDPYAARRAQALYKICSQALGADADADRATVIVHEAPDGSLSLDDGTGLPDSVAQHLRCDCREQHPDGSISQVISPALRRTVLARDGGCTFPGCEQRHWLQLHHVIWRSRSGPTEAWNLRARCGFHHQVVHVPGWREEFGTDGAVHIYRPDGTQVGADPPQPLRPELRHRLDEWLPFRGADPPDAEWPDTG